MEFQHLQVILTDEIHHYAYSILEAVQVELYIGIGMMDTSLDSSAALVRCGGIIEHNLLPCFLLLKDSNLQEQINEFLLLQTLHKLKHIPLLHNVSIRLGLEIGLFDQLTKITLLQLIGRVDLRILLWIRSSDSIIHDHWDHFAKTLLMISLITYYHPFAFLSQER